MNSPDGPSANPSPQPDPALDRDIFRRAESIFFEVAHLSPADRDEAVGRLSGGDERLRAMVAGLLSSAAQVGSFLEQPVLGDQLSRFAQESGQRVHQDDLVGTTVGQFRIARRIASGGMGTVYLAHRSDGQFEQTVALKIVKRGLDTEEILQRFRAERQTLAALDHPNIARLLDGGITADGRPFLVMEHVEGKPIDAYCDEQRLRIKDRLQLFRSVCAGVQHAHANLVIHRDLKPSNILVTPQGVPKLLDFGIAKVLSGGTAQLVTTDADRRLTPEYASPEQVEGGSMTTATDVYALGVVLYELLTGSRPYFFHIRTAEELRRIVCNVIPPPPSAAVTGRSLRARSSPSSSVQAANPGETGTETPLAQRGVDVPATRGVSSTRLRSQLRGDLDNIVLKALRKEPHRRYESAEQFAADIGRYLDGMPVQAHRDTVAYRASKFVRRHPGGIGLAVAIVAALAAAVVVYSNQSHRLRVQRDELLSANKRLNENRRYLQTIISGGETGVQGPDARLGTVLRDAAAALESSPPEDEVTLAAARQALGRAVMSLGMLPEARRLLEQAEQGFAAHPGDSLTDIRIDLAELLFFEGKHAEAESQLRALLAAEQQAIGSNHSEREGLLLNDLGASLRIQGKLDEAIVMQRAAIVARSASFGAQSLPVAESQNNLASALVQKGDVKGGVKEFEQALAIRRPLLRPDHPLIVRLQANLGLAKLRAGQAEEAVEVLTAAANAWDAAFGAEHPGRISTMTSLSMALRQLGKQPEALAWLNRALDWQRQHQADSTVQIAATQAHIGITLAQMQRDAQAEETLVGVLPQLKTGGPTVAGIARQASEALAAIYERSGRAEQARRLRDESKKPEESKKPD